MGQRYDCEARKLRAQTRDQVPKQRSALPWVMATLGEERDWELRPRLQGYDVSVNQGSGGREQPMRLGGVVNMELVTMRRIAKQNSACTFKGNIVTARDTCLSHLRSPG